MDEEPNEQVGMDGPAGPVQPKLRLITDPETGEVSEQRCPGCTRREEEIRGLETEKRGWRTRFYNLEREYKGELAGHEMFPRAKKLHDYWRERCRHPNVAFDIEELKQALPRLKEHDDAMVRRAIDGAAYDPFLTQRKNGTTQRHDSWEIIMRKHKFMEFANKAPWHLPNPDHIKTLANALAWVWGWEPDRAVHEATERLK